jgi:exodeoxyribonuclease V beta subunit
MSITWIEASAGTGKTYTLVQTVLSLIRDRGLAADRILLVTFTEKATAELKTRIRKGLRDAWKATGNEALSKALEDLSQLTITTIHGFCRALLTQFPLESGVSFQPELVDQGRQWRRLLREELRPRLAGLDGTLLAWAGLEEEEELFSLALAALNQGVFQRAVTHPDADDLTAFGRLRADLEAGQGPLWTAVRALGNLELPPTADRAFGPEVVGTTLWKGRYEGCYAAARRLGQAQTWSDLVPLLVRGSGAERKGEFERLENWDEGGTMWKKSAAPPFEGPLEEVRAAVLAFVAGVHALESCLPGGSTLSDFVAGCARYLVLSDLCVPVLGRGSDRELTFADLIERVHRLVTGEPQGALAQGASARWKAVLIDEFQDTDLTQWEIFRTLFGTADHELTLVGDPKQSIYRFRGADLEVYRTVRDQVLAQGARRELLAENFRSTEAQIGAVNRLFDPSMAPWDHPDDFSPSRKGDKPIPALFRHHPGGVKEVAPYRAYQSCPEAVWHRHLVASVLELLDGTHFWDDGLVPEVPLEPGDILILVRKKREAWALYRMLTARGIPATVGGSGGLLGGREAQEILLFLKALEQPRSLGAVRALGWTRLFAGADPEVLATALDEARDDRDRGAYLRAFRTVAAALEPGVSDGGGLEALLARPGGARMVTNAEHVLELVQERHHRGEVAPGRAALSLETWIASGLQEDEVDLRRDTEARTLRLMTIHSAKGLEAPVVFHGYPSEGAGGDPRWLVAGGVDFLFTQEARESEDRARRAEELRLRYVALTRARAFQVFPAWEGIPAEETLPVPVYTPADWSSLGSWTGHADALGKVPELTAPVPGLENRHPWVESHSGLWRRATAAEPGTMTVWDRPRGRDAEAEPADLTLAEALPAGPDFGDLVHDLLETADFRGFGPAASEAQKREVLEQAERLAQGRRSLFRGKDLSRPLVSWLSRVLPEPLALGPETRPVVLTDLDPTDTRRELEFHLPLAQAQTARFLWGGRPFVVHPGFLTGRIDLLFRWDGGLYLADWKTNRLAPGQDPKDLMADSGYDLQAQWYWEALGRLCRTQGETLVPRGVLYIFLRGTDDKPRGVFLSPEELQGRRTLRPFLEKETAHG